MSNSQRALCELTNTRSVEEAIAWIAEELPLSANVDWGLILRCLVDQQPESESWTRAVRRATSEASASSIDSGTLLFDPEAIPEIEEIREALSFLRRLCGDDGIGAISPRAVHSAYLTNPFVLDVVCAIAGITTNEAASAVKDSDASWSEASIEKLLAHIEDILRASPGEVVFTAERARPIELRGREDVDWTDIEAYITKGVSYETLLAQRIVGSAWGAHRNRTSSKLSAAVMGALSEKLSRRGVDHRRSTTVGGHVSPRDLQSLAGIQDKRLSMAIVKNGHASLGIVVSSARDGGTARANGDGLLQIPDGEIPVALVLIGLGWSNRHETDRLAVRFGGRLFTDQTLDRLVEYAVDYA